MPRRQSSGRLSCVPPPSIASVVPSDVSGMTLVTTFSTTVTNRMDTTSLMIVTNAAFAVSVIGPPLGAYRTLLHQYFHQPPHFLTVLLLATSLARPIGGVRTGAAMRLPMAL